MPSKPVRDDCRPKPDPSPLTDEELEKFIQMGSAVWETMFVVWDLDSAEIALEDYLSVKTALLASFKTPQPNDSEWRRINHYAAAFVTAMHRLRRHLEDFYRQRSKFPPSVQEVVKAAWDSNRVMLEQYHEVRNVLEHLHRKDKDGKPARLLRERVRISVNHDEDKLHVTGLPDAHISAANLDAVVKSIRKIWDAMSDSPGGPRLINV